MSKRSLMPHQRKALAYARRQAHPALWMDMRLRKTLVAVRRALMYRPRRAEAGLRILVVAPVSALGAWADELDLEGQEHVFLRGSASQRRKLLAEDHRWFLLNKEGYQAVPEIANRVRCETCAGRGKQQRACGTVVVNRKAHEFDVDIGRPSKWGNPFKITKKVSRADVIKKHMNWLKHQKELLAALPDLVGKRLGCYCKPLACHGDNYVKLVQALMPWRKCPRCRGLGSVPSARRWAAWDAVILDESTFVKNPQARVTRFFLENFRDVPHRLSLTGMPDPEGPLDLWCQITWLDGEAFGAKSFWEWRAGSFHPDARKWGWHPNPGVEEAVGRSVGRRCFALARSDVDARFASQKVYETRRIELPAWLRKAYRTAEREFVLELDGKEISKTIFAGTRWQWLRQMCGGFVDHKLVWPGKINELVSLLTGELARQSVVTWSCYNQEIKAAERAVRKAKIGVESLTGKDTPEARRKAIERFNGGWFTALIAQQAGDVAKRGIDLSTADTTLYFSNWPGREARAQSEDRIVDMDKHVPLLYVDLVVRDTVDEDVAALLRDKRVQSDRMMRRAVVERMRGRA